MTGHQSHSHRTDCGWTSREATLQKRTWGSRGAAGWGAAPQEGHQQSKGSDSCPPFSTHEAPCEALRPVLGPPSNSKYSEKLERLQWQNAVMGRGMECGLLWGMAGATAPLQLGEEKTKEVTAVASNPRGVIKLSVRLFSEVHEEEWKTRVASCKEKKFDWTQGNYSKVREVQPLNRYGQLWSLSSWRWSELSWRSSWAHMNELSLVTVQGRSADPLEILSFARVLIRWSVYLMNGQ